MQDRLEHCLLLCSRVLMQTPPEALKDTGVQRWFSAFAFLKIPFLLPKSLDDMYYEYYTEEFCYSHALCNICVFYWSHTQNRALSHSCSFIVGPVVQGFVSIPQHSQLALLPWVTLILTHRSFALFFDPPGFLGFALCDLANKCLSSDATLNALAADAVNLLWHRVRPFCEDE